MTVRAAVTTTITNPSEPIFNVVGEQVALGPIRRDLLATYARWMNDFAVTRTLAIGQRPMTIEAEEQWLATASTGPNAIFTIYELRTGRAIGNCSVENIDHVHRTATFGIVIGERDCWGNGYGTEATRLTLDYAFNALNLHNVMLTVYSDNPRAIGVYERVGFCEIGRRRQARRLAGEWIDVIYMDCLSTDFRT
jgi:RimJ/RimL family protein N-acetyltransferase